MSQVNLGHKRIYQLPLPCEYCKKQLRDEGPDDSVNLLATVR